MKVHSLKADLRPMEGHCLDFRDTQSPDFQDRASRCIPIPRSYYTPGPQNESRVLITGVILDHGGMDFTIYLGPRPKFQVISQLSVPKSFGFLLPQVFHVFF